MLYLLVCIYTDKMTLKTFPVWWYFISFNFHHEPVLDHFSINFSENEIICQEQDIETAHLEFMQCLWNFLISSYWGMLNGEFMKLTTFFCWLLPPALQHIDSSISSLALTLQPDSTSCSLSCVEEQHTCWNGILSHQGYGRGFAS